MTVNLVSPKEFAFPQEYLDEALKGRENQVKLAIHSDLSDDLLAQTDVLYVTRLQRERLTPEQLEKCKTSGYNVDSKTVEKLKKTAIVMHPLPRVDELDESVDKDPRARYFKQIYLGTFMRAALLWNVLGKCH